MPLSLKFTHEAHVPRAASGNWRGCSAEHVVVPENHPYEFSYTGDMHYLALHDIRLADGELKVDTVPTVRARDLRDTFTFVPKGCAVSGWAKPEIRRNAFTAVYFDPAILHTELEERYTKAPPAPAIYARDPALLNTLRKIHSVVSSPDGDGLHAEALCLTAALEVFGVLTAPETERLSDRQMQIVRAFIDEFLDQPISLSDLAGAIGRSRHHFSRAFKATTGQPPYRFLAAQRVKIACSLLTTGALSLDAVAGSVGFSSTAQLRRAFQTHMGMTPQAFLRNST